MIKELYEFLMEKEIFKKVMIESFDRPKLKLAAIDFIS